MPLVRISVYASMPAPTKRHVADAVYDSMRTTLSIPDLGDGSSAAERPSTYSIPPGKAFVGDP